MTLVIQVYTINPELDILHLDRPTGSFTYSGSNFYSNVYSNDNDAISFGTTTSCSISNIRAAGDGVTTFDSAVSQASMPALNNSADCETTTLQVTGTVLFDHTTSISGGLESQFTSIMFLLTQP